MDKSQFKWWVASMYDAARHGGGDELMLLSSLLSDEQKDELRRLYNVARKKYQKLQYRRHRTYAGCVKFQYGRWLIQYANRILYDLGIFRMILKQVLPNEYNDD